MDRRVLIIALLALFLSIIPFQSHAYPNSSYICLDDDVSQYNRFYNDTNVDGTVNTLENITCGFGCNINTGECNETGISDIGVMIMIPIIVLVLAYVGASLAKEEWVLQMLFLLIGLFLLILDISIAIGVMRNLNTDVQTMLGGGLWAMVGLTLLTVMYYLLKIFTTAVKTLETGK
jgi:hypothetical protein